MRKLKGNSKKIKKAVFNIGPIILLLLVAFAIFMIGRAIGRKEYYSPIIINEHTKSLKNRDFNDAMIRQRLLNLSQI